MFRYSNERIVHSEKFQFGIYLISKILYSNQYVMHEVIQYIGWENENKREREFFMDAW